MYPGLAQGVSLLLGRLGVMLGELGYPSWRLIESGGLPVTLLMNELMWAGTRLLSITDLA